MRYRDDQSHTNAAGQTIHSAKWMGGLTTSKVEGAKCPDGVSRTAFVTGEADTYFSLPAYVHHKSKRVKGFLTVDDGVWHFHSPKLAPHEVLPNLNNRRVKVGDLVFNQAGEIARVIGWAERDGLGVKYDIPNLLVLQLGNNHSDAYERHWPQDCVWGHRPPAPDQGAFMAWFMGGALAPAEELHKQYEHGMLNERYYRDECRADGGRKNR